MEISPFICSANQSAGFYMIMTSQKRVKNQNDANWSRSCVLIISFEQILILGKFCELTFIPLKSSENFWFSDDFKGTRS